MAACGKPGGYWRTKLSFLSNTHLSQHHGPPSTCGHTLGKHVVRLICVNGTETTIPGVFCGACGATAADKYLRVRGVLTEFQGTIGALCKCGGCGRNAIPVPHGWRKYSIASSSLQGSEYVDDLPYLVANVCGECSAAGGGTKPFALFLKSLQSSAATARSKPL